MTDLERLVAIEDIRTLAMKYSHYRDALYLDELANLFAEDGSCEFGARFGGTVNGRAAIRRHFDGSRHYGGGRPYGTVHAISTHWVEMTGENTAEGRCYLTDYVCDTDEPLKFVIIYDDSYIRIDGTWKFQCRRLEMIWPDNATTARMPGEGRTA